MYLYNDHRVQCPCQCLSNSLINKGWAQSELLLFGPYCEKCSALKKQQISLYSQTQSAQTLSLNAPVFRSYVRGSDGFSWSFNIDGGDNFLLRLLFECSLQPPGDEPTLLLVNLEGQQMLLCGSERQLSLLAAALQIMIMKKCQNQKLCIIKTIFLWF